MPFAAVSMGPWSHPQQGGGGGGGENPLSLMNQMLQLRGNMMKYQGQQALGNALATHDNLDDVFTAYSQDPSAAFNPEGLETIQRMRLSGSQMQTQAAERGKIAAETTGKTYENNTKLMEAGLRYSMGDPEEFHNFVFPQLDAIHADPETRLLFDQAEISMSGPNGLHKTWGKLVGMGLDPLNASAGMTGYTPGTVTYGTGEGAVQLPILKGVGPDTQGQQIAPPGYNPPGSIPAPPASPASPPATPTLGAYVPDETTAGPPMTPAMPYGRRAYVNPNDAEAAGKLIGTFNSEDEQTKYRGNQRALGLLQTIDTDVNKLQAGGGWTIPGTGLEGRTEFGRKVNTLFTGIGLDPPLSPELIASGESLNKAISNAVFAGSTEVFGGNKEAATTYNMFSKGVPGMDNSGLGFKVLTSSMRAVAQRDLDRHNFIRDWSQDPRHVGGIVGAEEAFNNKYKMQDYLDRELGQYGLDHTGKFHSYTDVGKLYADGLISEDQFRKTVRRDNLVRKD
jgi:hypothetical protein